jgi:anti-sigma regulatory factor (Ser/Thr protein kinase)
MSDDSVRQTSREFDGGVASIADARTHARAFFEASVPRLDGRLLGDALVAVSELVTNAVCHAPGPCVLALGDDGRRITIAVSDTHHAVPGPRPKDLEGGGGGLGWHVLRRLSGSIETELHPVGKTVAVTLDRARVQAPATEQ